MRVLSRSPQRKRELSPTPQEIREECLKLQEGWSDRQRQSRSCYCLPRWTIPIISSSDLLFEEEQ
jgi:hypothetical protein